MPANEKTNTKSATKSNFNPTNNSNDRDFIDSKEKMPLKSINGRRCLSRCYPRGSVYLHPVILQTISDSTKNSCAVDPVYSKDAENYPGYDLIFVDKCRIEDNKTHQEPNELESILLSFYFNPSDFLVEIYGLNTFDQVIYWTLENDHLPTNTIKRVHNCAWRVYGDKIDELSGNVLDYYYDIAKLHWLRDYAKIIKNKYSFDVITKKSVAQVTDSGPDNEIYQILSKTFFSYEFFVKAIKRYVYEHQDQWESIDSHYSLIKKYILASLVERIDDTEEKLK